MLPNFIVIGAAKAGTTALYWYLAEHPQIHMSRLKETNFFAYGVDTEGRPLYGDPELHRFPVRTLEEYEEQFVGANGVSAVGEASPIYLECPQAAGRIASMLPEAVLICGLRDPVDRAYSDYLMYLRNRGRQFDAARDLSPNAAWAHPDSHWMRIGKYHELLSRYFAAFRREQIHVYLFDEMKRDPRAVVQGIYRALGVAPGFVPDFDTPHNVGGVPANMRLEALLTNKRLQATLQPLIPRRLVNAIRKLRTSNLEPAPPLPQQLRDELKTYFRDDIAGTSALIGRDLGHWLD